VRTGTCCGTSTRSTAAARSACPARGVLTGYTDALHAPDGAIHLASTETATVWAGYMDGAARAGEEVADAVGRLL